jgi:hypothetical protein
MKLVDKVEGSIKAINNDWYIDKQHCWNLVRTDGTDAISIHFHENIDYKTFVEDFKDFNFNEVRKIIEEKVRSDGRYYFSLIYGVG